MIVRSKRKLLFIVLLSCVLPTRGDVIPTPTPTANPCTGQNLQTPGAIAGAVCDSQGTCTTDLQCNIPSNRCYTCPVGNLGCACDGSSNCMLGLVCLAGVCTPNPSALTGELGQDCRPGPDANPPQPANLQCNLANAYCDPDLLICVACTPVTGAQLGCACSTPDNCAGGLTCDNPSASCVPCRSACSNACARTFAPAPTVPPEMLCPSLDCYQCRSMNSTCKYCNLGGDGNCAAADVYCPSNYAKGDDSIQCGGVLKAPTLPLRINANCSKETCQGCFSYPNCKFCNAMGDWSCVSTAATCPSGAQTNPPPVVDLCGAAVPTCYPDCGVNGYCMYDMYGMLTAGRPVCMCNSGYKSDPNVGCLKLTVLLNSAVAGNGQGVDSTVVIGMIVALVVFCGFVAFLAVYLRRRARRTVIVADVTMKQNEPLAVADDGTVKTADGVQAFKCLEPGCPKAYFTQEDLDRHIAMRHAPGGGGGDFSGATFNNGATFAGLPPPQGFDAYPMPGPGMSGVYDNNANQQQNWAY